MRIRPETHNDAEAIARVITRAFSGHPYSGGNESAIITKLRAAQALSVALVAERDGQVLGFVAASPVQIEGQNLAWYGLGPLAVDPSEQGKGIGIALTMQCLNRLRELGAAGCVVLGSPAYYNRFGFRAGQGLTYASPRPAHFMSLSLKGKPQSGRVAYHAAFLDGA